MLRPLSTGNWVNLAWAGGRAHNGKDLVFFVVEGLDLGILGGTAMAFMDHSESCLFGI